MNRRIRCRSVVSSLGGALLLIPAPAAGPPADAVSVTIEGGLTSSGALGGTLTAIWRGRPAADLRARLKGLEAAPRDAKLLSMLPSSLAGKVASFADSGNAVTIVHSIDAPRFALPSGGSLEVAIPVYSPFDWKGAPAPPLPLAVIHDLRLGLPPGMAPASLPSAFSTVTPSGGRYLLYYDVEGPPPGRLIARREMAIDAASLGELIQAAGAHDGAAITLVPAPPRAPPRP